MQYTVGSGPRLHGAAGSSSSAGGSSSSGSSSSSDAPPPASSSESSSPFAATRLQPAMEAEVLVHGLHVRSAPAPASAEHRPTSSSASSFVAVVSAPYILTVDESRHFAPIELVHAQSGLSFRAVAANALHSLLAIIDNFNDLILLQRTSAEMQRAGELQWQVAMELRMPERFHKLVIK